MAVGETDADAQYHAQCEPPQAGGLWLQLFVGAGRHDGARAVGCELGENLRLARLCDEAGIEFLLPIARWKGYGGATDFEGETWETITWAGGLLAATRAITVFGTVHVALVHPVFAAKQFVTVDHMSGGRFGLNIVCGWNQDDSTCSASISASMTTAMNTARNGGRW